ncbi:uncharacterized protein LACBIDRAFT_334007 [Laccaria bicolor S238N-H82]|uniref:Predicted protein n=1 Tax=Laccaria bicolor (strain S238N-H82 / ATCC MYA-4686) TaxID=486041 RepID=B0DXS6_LACBS|nr:uncharacterized protein LACBIDRAFT_334007 [Laccaria bicolor S238N-H82]EDR00516.1 predicted protein [Laccaria bicolor S238N-H82]|eukprot:XP_001888743.1 predicted protein [Laccaria bicolor S238N-H82]
MLATTSRQMFEKPYRSDLFGFGVRHKQTHVGLERESSCSNVSQSALTSTNCTGELIFDACRPHYRIGQGIQEKIVDPLVEMGENYYVFLGITCLKMGGGSRGESTLHRSIKEKFEAIKVVEGYIFTFVRARGGDL